MDDQSETSDAAAATGMPRIRGDGRRIASLPPVHPVLWALVGLISAIELLLEASDARLIGGPRWRDWANHLGAFQSPVLDGTWPEAFPGQGATMFLTHAFLHGDFLHLVMNMVVLLALGKLLTSVLGPARMLFVFAATAVAGALAFWALNGAAGQMVGASGAVFGFIGVWKFWEWRGRRAYRAAMRPLWSSLLALVIANFAVWWLFSGLVAWEAHLGGFLAGWVIAAVISPPALVAAPRAPH